MILPPLLILQGYEDRVDDDEHDDIEDASYADEEYGAKKKPAKKKKRVRTPTISAIRPKGWCATVL